MRGAGDPPACSLAVGLLGHLLTDSRHSVIPMGPQLEVVKIQVSAGLRGGPGEESASRLIQIAG